MRPGRSLHAIPRQARRPSGRVGSHGRRDRLGFEPRAKSIGANRAEQLGQASWCALDTKGVVLQKAGVAAALSQAAVARGLPQSDSARGGVSGRRCGGRRSYAPKRRLATSAPFRKVTGMHGGRVRSLRSHPRPAHGPTRRTALYYGRDGGPIGARRHRGAGAAATRRGISTCWRARRSSCCSGRRWSPPSPGPADASERARLWWPMVAVFPKVHRVRARAGRRLPIVVAEPLGDPRLTGEGRRGSVGRTPRPFTEVRRWHRSWRLDASWS
jgi:hypothetical protein